MASVLARLRAALRSPAARHARHASPAPARLLGKVEIDFSRCTLRGGCAEACPTPALRLLHEPAARRATLTLDHGHCIFCGLCEEACGEGAIRLTNVFELATRRRTDLVTTAVFADTSDPLAAGAGQQPDPGPRLRRSVLDRLGRALQVRHIDAGSCNGCEAEARSLLAAVHDLSRFGIDFVASLRHADLLLVTGTVTPSLAGALAQAYAAVPEPRLVVAAGACAIGGGIFRDPGGAMRGLEGHLPVDAYVPGCPPRPQALIHGLLVALERMPVQVRPATWRGPYPDPGRA